MTEGHEEPLDRRSAFGSTVATPGVAAAIAVPQSAQLRPVFVVIATRGRAAVVGCLLDALARQSLQPTRVIVIGSEENDLAGLADHPFMQAHACSLLLAPMGLTVQRNVGVRELMARGALADNDGFVVFFDDDFRPAKDWLESCARLMGERKELAGLTGWVLADGVKGCGLSETRAEEYLSGRRAPEERWRLHDGEKEVRGLYGCNMAFRISVLRLCTFDEALSLHGWLEDLDFTGQVKRFGRVISTQHCRGVHLGVRMGRNSDLRLGYSQIANPLHIAARRNIPWRHAGLLVSRALVANLVYSMKRRPLAEYAARLRGNWLAILDLLRRRCRPQRISDIS